MLNCRLVVDVGSDFDSLNFAPFLLPQTRVSFSPCDPRRCHARCEFRRLDQFRYIEIIPGCEAWENKTKEIILRLSNE